jgi:hypothetical protein
VLHTSHKRRLRQETGASAVDMESFQAAALAAELGVPFVAVRVIADSGALTYLATDALIAFRALVLGREKLGPRFASPLSLTVVERRAANAAATKERRAEAIPA